MTRRSVLAAGAVLAAGCGNSAHRGRRSTPNPDADALADAVRREAQLLASYDAAIARSSGHVLARLRVGRAAHAVHLNALRQAAHLRPSAGTAEPIHQLSTMLSQSADRLAAAAVEARLGVTAALLASVAGSHRAMSVTAPREGLRRAPTGGSGAGGGRGG